MAHYTPLPDGSLVRDDRGTEWRLLRRAPDDDGTPAYWAEWTGGTKVKKIPRNQKPIVLSCFIVEVLSVPEHQTFSEPEPV